MEVAEIGARFQRVSDQVTKMMEKKRKLKPILGFLLATLNSLRDETIQHHQISDSFSDKLIRCLTAQVIHCHHISNSLRDEVIRSQKLADLMIDSLIIENLDEGEEQLAKVSKLRSWRLGENTDRTLVKVLTGLLRSRNRLRVIKHNRGVDGTVVALTAEEVAAQERLFEAVKEMKEKKEAPWMIRHLLENIYEILNGQDGDKPIKVMMRRSLREEMDKGVEVVRRSSSSSRDSITELLALLFCISDVYINKHYD